MRSRRLFLALSFLCILLLCLFSCGESEVTVVFKVDGNEYATRTAASAQALSMPVAPTKEGYSFAGWYLEEGEGGARFTADYILTGESLTVYAHWTALHIHTESEPKVLGQATCIEEGTSFTSCTVCGATVSEWTTDAIGHDVCPLPAKLPTETSDGLTEGLGCSRCDAVFTEQLRVPAEISGCEIGSEKLALNGTALTATLPSTDSVLTLSEIIKINDASTYIASYDASGSQPISDGKVALEFGDNSFYITVFSGGDSAVYTVLVRRRPVLTVTFETAGGTAVSPIEIDEGGVISDLPVTTLAGYDFSGWSRDLTLPVSESFTATASWSPRSDTPYTVKYYKLSGGEYILADEKSLVGKTDTLCTIPDVEFAHYEVNRDKSDAPCEIKGDGTLALSIYLDPVKYTVSFDTGHGITMENALMTALEPYSPPSPPAREGYRFDKWLSGGAEWDAAAPVKDNVFLVASWVKVVTVTFDTSALDGASIDPITVDLGAAVTVNAVIPTAEDMTVAWLLDGEHWLPGYHKVTEDITVVAALVNKFVTVTFVTVEATPPDPITVEYGTAAGAVEAPVRGNTHYFEGWYIKGTDIKWNPETVPVTENITLEAKWTIMTPPDLWW